MTEQQRIDWMKLPIIGAPGTECGRQLLEGGATEPTDFPNNGCIAAGTWLVGMLFVCDEHGDDFDAIRDAWLREIGAVV